MRTGPDDLALLRAFEPVLRLGEGEYFLPVAVDGFLARATLVREEPGGRTVLAPAGTLDRERLASLGAHEGGAGLSLSAIEASGTRLHRWRELVTARRPRHHAGSRLAEVGLLGRTVDTLGRASLLLRGSVPGGSAAAAHAMQQEHLSPERPTYYGRVLRTDGWIVCQYWFFYCFNNWRSGYSGVNEHEGDWEQVTVFLDACDADGSRLPAPRWVAFSAHDEVGDDLRRRWDDPDLTVVEGTHAVVHAGAGSHSGAYLAGDYLITVAPPSWGGVVPAVRSLARLLAPWARAARTSGLGIPYVDYARGDGVSVGPGQDLAWHPVVVDDDTPWVRDYRGLWGRDTRDRLGGERGPAGPRYERDATVRASWSDPLGWAGLAKVAPGLGAEAELVVARVADIDAVLEASAVEIRTLLGSLRSRAAGLAPDSPEVRGLAADEARLAAVRAEVTRLQDERRRMLRATREGLPVHGPHAHLRRRPLPIARNERRRDRLLGVWSVVSTPIALYLLARLVRPEAVDRPVAALLLVVLVLGVEALARGYLVAYLVRVVALGLLVWGVVELAAHWQVITSWVLLVAAAVVLLVNVRDRLRR